MKLSLLVSAIVMLPLFAAAALLKVGDSAPLFEAKTHDGKDFKLGDRKAKGWTVLFFYPKADTPGCTKQACAFRDSIKAIREQGAEVFGVSADTVENQAKFHEKYHLTFPLIADPDAKILKAYGTKMFGLSLSKRWTFIIDPELKIRAIDDKVDPVMDAKKVGQQLADLQGKS